MTKKIEDKDVFVKNPYKSISFLLLAFPDGLEPKHILYELEKNHGALKLGGKSIPEYLEKNKTFNYSTYIKHGCISSSQHLTNCLTSLKMLNVVFKSDKKIKLSGEFINLGKTVLHLTSLRLYKPNSFFNRDFARVKEALSGGISSGFFKDFDKDDRELSENYLKRIASYFIEINNLGVKYLEKQWHNRLKDFYESTDSKKIKKILTVDYNAVFRLFNQPFQLYEIFGGKEITRHEFDISMGLLPLDDKRKEYFVPKSLMDDWLYKLKAESKGKKYNTKRFNKAWSKAFFNKDYDLSNKEILSMVNWAWDNIGFLRDYTKRFYLPAECYKFTLSMLGELGDKSIYRTFEYSNIDGLRASIMGPAIGADIKKG